MQLTELLREQQLAALSRQQQHKLEVSIQGLSKGSIWQAFESNRSTKLGTSQFHMRPSAEFKSRSDTVCQLVTLTAHPQAGKDQHQASATAPAAGLLKGMEHSRHLVGNIIHAATLLQAWICFSVKRQILVARGLAQRLRTRDYLCTSPKNMQSVTLR